MCTTVTVINKGLFFGRNMDIECGFGHRVVVVPRNFPLEFRKENTLKNHYAIIGMAAVMEGCPLFADGLNEFGLCGAGLNFPDNAYYSSGTSSTRQNVTPFELISWVLGKCANLTEAKELLKTTNIYNEAFAENVPLTPLHWHFADKTGSIVVEATKDGMHIYDNSAGVLTNNPPFDFHMTNLSQYLNLTNAYPSNAFTEKIGCKPFCKGMGAIGLPGDFSSPSRFVKASYLLANLPFTENSEKSVADTFHILDSVAVVRGSIPLENDVQYSTIYSCCMDADNGIYYYKTYDSLSVYGVKLCSENLNEKHVYDYSVDEESKSVWIN